MSKATKNPKKAGKWEVNEGRLRELIGTSSDTTLSPVHAEIVAAKNPDYQITTTLDAVPFKTAVDRLGASAVRVYFREKNRLIALTCSESLVRQLSQQLLEVLDDDS